MPGWDGGWQACDGVWDVMSSADAVAFVVERLEHVPPPTHDAPLSAAEAETRRLGLGLVCELLVDETLARAMVYTFLKGALCPRSAILFEWSHAPAGNADHRCWSAEQCCSG